MVAESSGARRTRVKECVCCGEPTATPSIPACWNDWNLLPEDLRSSIVKNYGRRQIKEYTDDLLTAVAFWRQIGAWRSKLRKKTPTVMAQSAPAVPGGREQRNVIALAERRRSPMQTALLPNDESEDVPDQRMTAAG